MRDNKDVNQCSDAERRCCNMLITLCNTMMSWENLEDRRNLLQELEGGNDKLPECTAQETLQPLGST